jgi:hypothetical protein
MSAKTAHTPAQRLIDRFGVKRLAAWSGRHQSRVWAWAWAPAKGGTGGVVPHRLRQRITEGALQEVGVRLTPADFEPADGEAYLFEAAA